MTTGSEHESGQHDDQHERRDDPQQAALQETPRVGIAQPALRHQIAAHHEEDLDPERALDDVAEPAADGQPDVAVAQMEDRQEDRAASPLRRFAEQVDQGAVAEPRCCRDGVHLDQVVDRMRARRRHRRQHFRGMVRLVEFPQQRNFMHGAVADPVAEIEQQHLSDGDDRDPGRAAP